MATILVIEDGDVMRSIVTASLRSRGHTVIEAQSGHEGLECHALASGGLDLVVCDLILPGLGGIGIISTLTARDANLPILAISGALKTLAYLGARDHSAKRAYLAKPFQLTELVETVDRLLLEPACVD
jgi:two-component system cell cycle sensor histidine kinase/response regulator CckA